MNKHYDVIVVGLGAMGSAALYQLSKLDLNVLGIDRFDPPHELGSSHGSTRFTRLGTGEGPQYFPLVKRSHEIWSELELKTGTKLFEPCGGLIMESEGSEDPLHGEDAFMRIASEVAESNSVDHQTLSVEEIAERFPQFNLIGSEKGYYEPGAGFLYPESCIKAQLDEAKNNGAEILTNQEVVAYEDHGDQVTVKTTNGSYQAKKVVFTAGAWMQTFFPKHKESMKVCRQVLYWFDLEDEEAYERLSRIPVFAWAFEDEFMYGFPAVDGPRGGIKVATEQFTDYIHPDELNREVSEKEFTEMFEKRIKERVPGVSSNLIKASVCMYTVSPDAGFTIDFHPKDKNVILASPCSGHGFKNSAAIGEVLAQLATQGESDIDISKFRIDR